MRQAGVSPAGLARARQGRLAGRASFELMKNVQVA
jgi:hypothetical protein